MQQLTEVRDLFSLEWLANLLEVTSSRGLPVGSAQRESRGQRGWCADQDFCQLMTTNGEASICQLIGSGRPNWIVRIIGASCITRPSNHDLNQHGRSLLIRHTISSRSDVTETPLSSGDQSSLLPSFQSSCPSSHLEGFLCSFPLHSGKTGSSANSDCLLISCV